MRVLAFDPGANRMGYAVIDEGPKEAASKTEAASGIAGFQQDENETYQEHRLRIIKYWAEYGQELINQFKPDIIASEIVPPTGGNSANMIHRQKAMAAITAVQVVALQNNIPIKQVAATTVKKAIGGSGKATKIAVRNGVYVLLPSTLRFKEEWKKIHDHSDAFAVGLTVLGHKIEKRTKRADSKT
jgi:crossover junction endodeoxyribonuclease RuvC